MGRRIEVDDLVSVTEIAQRLGLRRVQVVHTWIARYDDFPPPVKVLGEGGGKEVRIWEWPDVVRWYEVHMLSKQVQGQVHGPEVDQPRRLPGRPR